MTRLKVQPGEMYHYFPEPFETKNGLILKHSEVDEEKVKKDKLRAAMAGTYEDFFDLEPGTYTVLKKCYTEKDLVTETIMSDTPMELRTNLEFIEKANGHVLIAGFGLGFTLMNIQDKAEVKSIQILENDQEVIDEVASQLPLNHKVKIIPESVFDFDPGKNKWDTIWFDIWNSTSIDNWEDMKQLHRKYKWKVNRQNPNHFIQSWRREDVRRMIREENSVFSF